jgi:hypothetical protein
MLLEKAFNSFYKENVNTYLLEKAGIVKHLTHLEELILTQRAMGVEVAVNFIKVLLDTLEGGTDQRVITTIKYDGAPAIIAGINPDNNRFFVSTKSIANVKPKINYTAQDIVNNHGNAPGLAEKLKMALQYLPEVIKQGIYQCDFMFDPGTLYTVEHEGEKLLAFKPNTIVYTFPYDSEAAQEILKAKIGVIFHTKYEGAPSQGLTSGGVVNVNEFNKSSNVWFDDAQFKNVSGAVTLTKKEKTGINETLKNIISISRTVNWDKLPPDFYSNANTFINTLIRQGKFVDDPVEGYDSIVKWIGERYDKDTSVLKTDKGRERKLQQKEEEMKTLKVHKKDILSIFSITKKLAEIKILFIQKYNAAIHTRHFIAEPNGDLKVTAPEGYVAIDQEGNMIKLVDRLEFSRANFAVTKGEKFK